MHGKAKLTVGVVIKDGDKVLIVEHGKAAKHITGLYGLPAGKVELDESVTEACVREVKEETGLVISEKDLKRLKDCYYAEIEQKEGKKVFAFIVYTTDNFKGELSSSDETVPKWFNAKEIGKLNLLPNVREAVEEAFSG